MGRNWQLLGEVPDSDDEELGSQEPLEDDQIEDDAVVKSQDSYGEGKSPGELVLKIVLSPRRDNHFTRPSSPSSRRAAESPRTPSPTRISALRRVSLPPDDSDDEIDLVYDGFQDEERPQDPLPSSPPQIDGLEAPADGLRDENDALPQQQGPLRQSQQIQQPQGQSQGLRTSQISLQSRRSQHPQIPNGSQTPRQGDLPQRLHESPADAPPVPADPFSFSPTSSLSSLSRSPSPLADGPPLQASGGQVAARMSSPFPVLPDSPPAFRLGFVRSLRPRKPIQQHPYLLEGAQYARAMKSHGVKPVRTEYGSAPRKQVVDEDSQEQEFQQEEESLLPRQQRGHDSTLLEDSLYNFPSSQADLGDIALSSLTPRTSTPAHRLLPLSSQDAAENGTDNTSVPDEDDFPTPETFMLRQYKRQQSRVAKRQTSPQTSSAAKRSRLLDAALRDEPPRAKWIPVRMDSSPDQLPRSTARAPIYRPRSLSPIAFPPRQHIVAIADEDVSDNGNDEVEINIVREDTASHPKDVADEGQSDAEAVRKNSRRIKGVLPASWLRLDQQKSTRVGFDKTTATQRRPGQQNDQAPRKGVALPRQGQATSSLATLASLFDESDDENDNDNDSVVDMVDRPKAPGVESWDSDEEGYTPVVPLIDDEDLGSVMEDNTIDRMAPGVKRNSRPSTISPPRTKKSKTRTLDVPNGVPSRKTRQPKITKIMNRSASSSTADRRLSRNQPSSTSRRRSNPHASSSRRTRKPPTTPPLLSILDFVEPTAPAFIRVAARTARRKTTLGKTSPSRKMINLGSRGDNVDALSVLRDWRAGKIKPKIPNPPRRPRQSGQQRPLQEMSPNLAPHAAPRPPAMQKATSARRSETEAFVNRISQSKLAAPPRPPNLLIDMATRMDAMMRPAQLETAARSKPGAAGFISKKKELDDMYRRRRRDAAPLPNVRLEQFVDNQAFTYGAIDEGVSVDDQTFDSVDFGLEQEIQSQPTRQELDTNTKPKTPENKKRSRFRKRYNPRQVDTSAPRFAHALDPIPLEIDPVTIDLMVSTVDLDADKLHGLGLFGSQYPQHFDIFPLDSDVFFHQGTLIGSGRLSLAFGTASLDNSQPTCLPNPTTSFQLDERTLSWSTWDEVSSSEYGILMDWLADSLYPPASLTAPSGPKVHTAVNFILDFIQSTMATATSVPSVRKAFVVRSLEAIKSFLGRFEASGLQQGQPTINTTGASHLVALTGILAIIIWLLQICRDTPECVSYSFQVEDMLKAASKLSAKVLLKHGLDDIRASYSDFQRGLFQDRGIRRNMHVLNSWVVLMQVLEHARIPRAGFWDVTYSAMLADKAISSCTNAGQLEQLWEDMFTLLPLGEFDSSGVVRPGIRLAIPLDGWELPKKALDRVFQLYKANPHQSPSFNAYFRAIVGRCHYLVQEWGWRRCKAIVGTVFDFYGSQGFAHLRNEEAHRSPRFLEELAASPSLAIEPDDKSFHIFIKMLGLVILQLKRLGQSKEMTNLVSRILPNHDRQLLKEMDVHERDLAALRNHHDLLCTLFWAASPDIRPPIHQIEKLVVPANSHKEACLINIRAWNQLARFVTAADEGYSVYKGFNAWMKNIFQQMLDQYLSAETDMHRQFQNLSTAMMQGISPDMVKAMAAANRAAAMDVLHACVVSSLDVLRHAKSLGVATYCFNVDQLSAIFTKMDLAGSKTNWSILSTALDVVDHYMDRLEKAMDDQYSSSADAADPQEADDAVLMLDHRLAKGFFRLNNTITHMSWEDLPQSAADLRVACTERSVTVAARLASRFIHSGVYGLSRFFGSGDYCIFERLPHAPGLMQRKFLPLFVSAVIRSNVFDFKDLGNSILELWMLAIVKPQRFLAYENRLAEVLRQHDLPYVRRAHVPANDQAPNYDTNRAFFACAMMSIRQQLRDADGAARRQQLRGDFARLLKLVMQQMKEDLKYAKTEPTEHEKYIVFVRGIVALIRSHGSDICSLDNFFYDQSQEFSPSPEDPQLRTASIITYGLRLGEGEATAAPQLFHYLHNNFNIALANNKLDQECKILERSMENDNVLGFMMERMLPAILRATSEAEEAWPLLDVYYSAIERFVTRSPVPKDIGDENVTGGVIGLLEDIVARLQWAALTLAADAASTGLTAREPGLGGAASAAGHTRSTLFCVRVHTMAQLAALANLLQPYLMTCLCLPCAPTIQGRLDGAIVGFHRFVESVLADLEPPRIDKRRRYVPLDNGIADQSDVSNKPAQQTLFSAFLEAEDGIVPSSLWNSNTVGTYNGNSSITTAMRRYTGGNTGPGDRAQVDHFSRKVVQHVRDNWIVDNGSITVRKAGTRPSIGGAPAMMAAPTTTVTSGAGVPFGPWSLDELLAELQRQLQLWKLRPAGAYGMGPQTRRLFPGRLRETEKVSR